MKWTRAKPTAPGEYWYRAMPGVDAEMMRVCGQVDSPGRLFAYFFDVDASRDEVVKVADVKHLSGEWAGPLSPPEE